MPIINRQRPRDGSAFATYAHQRQPRPLRKLLFWLCLLAVSVLFWGWLLHSVFAVFG